MKIGAEKAIPNHAETESTIYLKVPRSIKNEKHLEDYALGFHSGRDGHVTQWFEYFLSMIVKPGQINLPGQIYLPGSDFNTMNTSVPYRPFLRRP